MKSKLISIGICLVLLIVIFPVSEAQEIQYMFFEQPNRMFYEPIWLYPQGYFDTAPPSLKFKPNPEFSDRHGFSYSGDLDYDFHFTNALIIEADEVLNCTITGIQGRIYNSDISIGLHPSYSENFLPGSGRVNLMFQLRCDGNGDGTFEYIIDFPEDPQRDVFLEPETIVGEPIDMTNGTIVLEISNTGNQESEIYCSTGETYVQVPFDFDSDSDGIGDYSDPDDDNDGHQDRVDMFPLDPKEWQDSDGDGIGDNEDRDNNQNGIPDDLEIPLALCILLIPIVIISVTVRHHKKRSHPKKGGDSEAPKITNSHPGPKNW